MAFAFLAPLASLATEGKPGHHLLVSPLMHTVLQDTIPGKQTVQPEGDEKNTTGLIKAVPKSRKQAKPVSIQTRVIVKPIRAIKPKLIKPIISIH